MKKLELNQMEIVEGGRVSANCGVSIAGALVFGTGAIIGAATGGVGAIAFAMAGSYFGWGMAAWSCS
jgi:phage tail tape-measure protein